MPDLHFAFERVPYTTVTMFTKEEQPVSDTITNPTPNPTCDEIAEMIWTQRQTTGAVNIRITDADGNSRDLDRTIEFWLAWGKLNRQDAEKAFVALETLRRILGIPSTT